MGEAGKPGKQGRAAVERVGIGRFEEDSGGDKTGKAARVLTDAVRRLIPHVGSVQRFSRQDFLTLRIIGRLQRLHGQDDIVMAHLFSESAMPRLPRGPRPASSATEDRKAIEQRARDAAVPFAPEKKGQWPFPIEDMDGANGSQEINNASGHNGDDRSVRSSQADQ